MHIPKRSFRWKRNGPAHQKTSPKLFTERPILEKIVIFQKLVWIVYFFINTKKWLVYLISWKNIKCEVRFFNPTFVCDFLFGRRLRNSLLLLGGTSNKFCYLLYNIVYGAKLYTKFNSLLPWYGSFKLLHVHQEEISYYK